MSESRNSSVGSPQTFSVKRAQVEFHNFASLGEPERAMAAYLEENRRRDGILRRHLDFVGPMTHSSRSAPMPVTRVICCAMITALQDLRWTSALMRFATESSFRMRGIWSERQSALPVMVLSCRSGMVQSASP